jgi:hypothetical protein
LVINEADYPTFLRHGNVLEAIAAWLCQYTTVKNRTVHELGVITGKLEWVRNVTNWVSLWALPPVMAVFGDHTLQMTGDWSCNCTFMIGNAGPGFLEELYVSQGSIAFAFLFAWFILFMLLVAVPIDFIWIGEDFEEWPIVRNGESRRCSQLGVVFWS